MVDPMAGIQAAVSLAEVSLSFAGAATPAVRDLSLSLLPGEHLALVGPSGSGKTTVLRLVAGFLAPDAGRIALGGHDVASGSDFLPPEQRSVGMVFQDLALFPHLSARGNVAFGLHRLPRGERERRTQEALDLVGLADEAERYPHQLSGGQQQRVALARALAPRPVVVLLDEPFSGLDAGLRQQVRAEVAQILRASGISALFVTHDRLEALAIGDRVAILRQGSLEQVGPPEQVFSAPASPFVAAFLGQTDFLPGEVTPMGIRTEIGDLTQRSDLPPGAAVDLAFRPDDVRLEVGPDGDSRVEDRNYQGMDCLYRIRLPSGRTVHSLQPHTIMLAPGTAVRVLADPGHALACFPRQAKVRGAT